MFFYRLIFQIYIIFEHPMLSANNYNIIKRRRKKEKETIYTKRYVFFGRTENINQNISRTFDLHVRHT